MPKSIDTFWVHKCVLDARKELGLTTDVEFYEHLLRMVVLSYRRTKLVPENIRFSMFVLFRKMLMNERDGNFIINRKYSNLDKAILVGNYNRYIFLCDWLEV